MNCDLQVDTDGLFAVARALLTGASELSSAIPLQPHVRDHAAGRSAAGREATRALSSYSSNLSACVELLVADLDKTGDTLRSVAQLFITTEQLCAAGF